MGTFKDPNYFVLICLLFISIFLIEFIEAPFYGKLFYTAVIFVYIFFLIITISRSGILTFLLYLTFLFFLYPIKFKKKFLAFIISLIIISILLIIFSPTTYFDIIFDAYKYRLTSESEVIGAMSRLYEIIAGFNYLFEEFPFSILGMGYSVSEIGEFFKNYYLVSAGIEPRIHNTYISLLIENGIIGFFLFVFMIYRNFRWLINFNYSIKSFFIPLYIATLFNSLFLWNLYFLPFYIIVFHIPSLIKKIGSKYE
jgi:O-antigen ligase